MTTTRIVQVPHYTYYPKPKQEGTMVTGYEYSISRTPQLDILDAAIKKVCDVRAKFGAEQNRLEHAHRINKNSEENTQAAESRIRDTDMAEEVVKNARYNILSQTGRAMLTQANQTPSGVLNLLR